MAAESGALQHAPPLQSHERLTVPHGVLCERDARCGHAGGVGDRLSRRAVAPPGRRRGRRRSSVRSRQLHMMCLHLAAKINGHHFCITFRSHRNGDQVSTVGFSGFSTVTCNFSPKLPVLPTNPADPPPSAEAAGTGVDGWDEPCPPGSSGRCVCVPRASSLKRRCQLDKRTNPHPTERRGWAIRPDRSAALVR